MKNIIQVSYLFDFYDIVFMYSVGYCLVVDQRLIFDFVIEVIVLRKLGFLIVWFFNIKGGDFFLFCFYIVWVIGGVLDCWEIQFFWDNYFGNGIGGQFLVYNWIVFNIVYENCVMRIRWVVYLCYVFYCMQICFVLIYLYLFDIDV